ncbi:acyl-CoA dehydrogenase family protein [Pseudorhodoferax sp.]|uniref:acyl-CoA dehydrogenase family protein n=1 Tax=Pseudorhodoferax sp. TaxID=1993553 RepID=UPI002DD676F6|nr:acyl-CoA dehydrogenase family protein [Pseudorhodoferax sp.]
MNHTLTLLADAVQRLLADTVSHRGTIEAEATGLDEAAWRQLSAIGVAGDAAAMSMAELAVVLEAVGAAGALVPYADSEALGGWLAQAAELDTGARIRTVAVLGEAAGQLRFERGAVTLCVEGMVIPWAGRADELLFSFRRGSDCFVAVQPARALEIACRPSIAGEPHGVVVSGPIAIGAAQLREVGAARGPEAVVQRGALCRAVQMLGAMGRANALALQYARDRKQFRRPLSDFQVIQSYLAAMAGELCAAAGMVQVAVDGVGGEEAFEAIASAKIRAGQAARQITRLAHQVHGAIGFTQEYPLNLWSRRLWAWREEYGNEAHWAAALGARVVQHGADALWPRLTQQTRTQA